MITLKLGQIAEVLNAKVFDISHFSQEVSGVSIDSRTTQPGDIFFALSDVRDGHDFAQAAADRGAKAIVVARRLDIDIPQLFVIDTLKALGDLAKWYRTLFDIPIIAITGSVGKTTTREMVRHILSTKYKVASAPGNFNNLIGLPLSMLSMDYDTEVGVFELGINQPGEMEVLADICQPDIAIVTKIAPVHLEYLGTLENIANEKLKLWKTIMARKGRCIYNLDDELLEKYGSECSGSRITFGVKQDADFYASKINLENGYPSFNVDEHSIELKTLGIHNVYNALAAYACAVLFEIPPSEIADSLSSYEPFNGRMKTETINGITIVDDSYNASPIAVKSGISTVSLIGDGRRYAVLGDMLELGLNETRYHSDILQFALNSGIDGILLVGPIYGRALEELHSDMELRPSRFFADNIDIITHFKSRDELKKKLAAMAEPGSLFYFKGSKKMNMSEFIQALKGGK